MSFPEAVKPYRGKHRADDPAPAEIATVLPPSQGGFADLVPTDLRDALAHAVQALGEQFDPEEWTFNDSTLLVWEARRVTPTGGAHDRVVFAPDCRSVWVPLEHDAEDAVGALNRDCPMSRTQIEFLLDEEVPRLGKGEWHLSPVQDLGWVCSREFRFRGRKHFLVSRDQQVRPVEALSPHEAAPLLAAMVAEPPTTVAA